MKKEIKELIIELKDKGEEYELYPTTFEMLEAIKAHYEANNDRFGSVLDIGCGTCNFYKVIKPYNYFVIEKSRVLIDRLPAQAHVLGCDFMFTPLIDKEVDTIFCNPPYSQFEHWAERIILEGNCKDIILVIPERWKDSPAINAAIKEVNAEYKVIGSFDFHNAERAARAKVDIVKIHRWERTATDTFNKWFDDFFKINTSRKEDDEASYEREAKHEKEIKNALVGGQNKIEILLNLYEADYKKLYENFKAVCSLDADVLKTIGVKYSALRTCLWEKIKGLKNLYWKEVFSNLEEITSRLTQKSRSDMLDRFTHLKSVEFTYDNIYALVMWVLKNADSYKDSQLVEVFKELTEYDNVRKYKSNQNTFEKERWRFADSASHYTLDYRIVCSRMCFKPSYSWKQEIDKHKVRERIGDFCVIAKNLGFAIGEIEVARSFGEKYLVTLADDKPLFEYRIYKNDNIHIKFNKEFAKAFNVEAARLLGWIRSKEDIKAEFVDDMADGAEKYFHCNRPLILSSNFLALTDERKA